jgi:hypothetical protein
MKKLVLGALLSLSMLSFAQNDSIKVGLPTLESYLVKEDKFNGEKTYRSSGETLSIYKVARKNINSQYISIYVYDNYLASGTGVYILFDNGQKIIRSKEEVDYDVNPGSGPSYRYSAFFTPTQNEINLFKTRKVVSVKLYIFDTDINPSESDEFQVAAKVLLKTQVKKKK